MPTFAELTVRLAEPFNAEPAADGLVASYVTPNERFFLRTHGTTPDVSPQAHVLHVGGRVRAPLALRVPELRERFAEHRVVASLQCAGNRRSELDAIRSVGGVMWEAGAVGNAEWSGVLLADVLAAAGCEPGDLHVQFESIDECEVEGRRFPYGASIPLAKALRDVVLADRMNGVSLPREHGGPLRVIVPAYYGVRSVKWLGSIVVADEPSPNYFQRVDYKLYPPDADPARLAESDGPVLNEVMLNAAICSPAPGARVPAGKVPLRGYATVGEGRIARVEVSGDGGTTWREASLAGDDPYAWRLWEADVELAPGAHELVVRAWDAAERTQPSHAHELWNPKGYGNNAWHRVRVDAV